MPISPAAKMAALHAGWRRSPLHASIFVQFQASVAHRLMLSVSGEDGSKFVGRFPFQTDRHFAINTRISRANFRCRARVRDCFFGFALGEKRGREGKMCAVITCRHRECVRPKRISVAPESGLMISTSTERDDDNGGCKRTALF